MDISFLFYSRGRQPLGLVAQNREKELSELFKIFTFVFFSDLGSIWFKKNEGKFFFSNRTTFQTFRLSDFQPFRLSVFQCFSQNLWKA